MKKLIESWQNLTIKEMIEEWENLGFLVKLNTEQKERFAVEYKKIVNWLLEKETQNDIDNFKILIFPILYRIIYHTDDNVIIDVEKIMDLFFQCQEKIETRYLNDINVDKDIEICELVSETYTKKYRNNNFNNTNKINS